ncbi:MAG TPA: polyprenyl synthetase family protein [Candidatus Limnocylindria bacterium]|nr:polyprenyl synthetase family protein [Candidatus Limnocylindria bacterium]
MTAAPINFVSSAPTALPRLVPLQKWRAPKKNIPPTLVQRQHILMAVREYVARVKPVPPLPSPDLKIHADKLVAELGCDPIFRDFVGVLVNNEIWREQLAGVPFERRLLLLPKCLRVEAKCPAPFDEFGLLCKQCGLCSIQDLTNEAEKLGYAVLVAEGSAIVMSLIQTGKIEAIVGVSCLSVLERAFPYMEAAAIPGVAVPLLQDDCIDTNVDLDWVWEYIHLTADDTTRRLDLGLLRDEVDFWFTPASLEIIMGRAEGETEKIAREWLMRAGKRWRPFLTVSTYQALSGKPDSAMPDDLRKVAVAIECFHKASLIHDDIEDNDALRYGEKTLHEEYGVAIALNVGDLLIGEGYRLLAACKASPEAKAEMLRVAAEGQRELCRGQGAELIWSRRPGVLTPLQVVDIFRQKTAPAFEVALRLGAIYAGQHEECEDVLGAYSRALGIAYQIRDDLSDLGDQGETNDIAGMRPSLLLAIARERANGENRDFLDRLWRRELAPDSKAVEALYRELKADERCEHLLESYKEEAIRSLALLDNPSLKGLLRRVVGKIFNDVEIKGWCKEQEQRNAASRLAEIGNVESAPVAA